MSEHWPTELKLAADRRTLHVAFEGGEAFALPAEYLRVCSPSAEVQGHTPAERKMVPGKRDVQILKVDPVGHYAVRLTFDDMHDSGIFTWTYLHQLGSQHDERWAGYLAELEAKGMSREPTRRR